MNLCSEELTIPIGLTEWIFVAPTMDLCCADRFCKSNYPRAAFFADRSRARRICNVRTSNLRSHDTRFSRVTENSSATAPFPVDLPQFIGPL
jgi:hypothetical protein